MNPALGRLIGPEDGSAESPANVAVVSWSCWKSRFNSDRAIIGRRIVDGDVPVTIVGVAPREFVGLEPATRQDIWLPLTPQPPQLRHHRALLAEAGGAVEAGCVHRAGPRGDERSVPVDHRGRIQDQRRSQRSRLEDGSAARRSRPLALARSVCEAGAGADGGGGAAAADCVHQCGQPAAGARGGPPAGNGIARLAGRRPLSPAAPGVDRVPAACRGGRPAGRLAGVFGHRRAGADHCQRAGAHRAPGEARWACAALHRRSRAADRRPVRVGSRLARVRMRSGGFPARRGEGRRNQAAAAIRQRVWW